MLGTWTALGRHGSSASQPPWRGNGRHRTFLCAVHRSGHGMVEGSWVARADARSPEKAHRRSARGSGLALDRRVGRAKRRGPAGASRVTCQVRSVFIGTEQIRSNCLPAAEKYIPAESWLDNVCDPHVVRETMSETLELAQQREQLPVAEAHGAERKRIVIIGAGFAGMAAARALRKCDAEIILIDRRNHHIFQPLLYQVATAILAPSEIAVPIRKLTEKQKNLSVLWGEIKDLNLKSRFVEVECNSVRLKNVYFDYLIVATGGHPGYFGHDEFARYAPTLKTIADAGVIRTKLLTAYEMAEMTDHAEERARQMTFVLVGAGPTGVELAASIAQLATVTLRSSYRSIDPANTSILLIEGGSRVLPSYAESLSKKAAKRLDRLGVKVITGAIVEKVDEQGVTTGGRLIKSATVLWTAGVAPSPIVKMLDIKTDRAGRACVGPFMNVPDQGGIFVVGDTSSLIQDGRPVPGVAQAAIQQGRYVGRFIAAELRGKPSPWPFRYFDKGNMAVIGKNFAVLESGRIRISGFLAWLAWAFVHIVALPERQNRMRVRMQWLWSYFTGQRSSLLMSERPQRGK